ncbi:MAG TPA: MerR family transcriptional regulator [Chloroflexaceae bacterium]|nr:MerR family transcriptional regulator [Chloroflexaceae bacterium]
MFKISHFSRLGQVPTSVLRYYDTLGLLQPAQVDPATGYRFYTAEQLPRLHRILALKDLGLSLEQIKLMLDDALSAEEVRGMLRLKQAELQQRVAEEQARLGRVAARLTPLEQAERRPAQDVLLKSLPAQPVLAVRAVVALPAGVAELLEDAFGTLLPLGVRPAGQPMVVFHDEEFRETDLDVELAIPVGATATRAIALPHDRFLSPGTLAAIEQAACTLHHSTFAEIADSYAALGCWIAGSGYTIAGPPREVYLTAPADDGRSLTEIQYPVQGTHAGGLA